MKTYDAVEDDAREGVRTERGASDVSVGKRAVDVAKSRTIAMGAFVRRERSPARAISPRTTGACGSARWSRGALASPNTRS